MIFQRSLLNAVTVSGIGLHSGAPVHLTMKPGRPGTGIVFVRTDMIGSPTIAAHYSNVVCTRLATTLGKGEVRISTVEHVLAALQMMDIDNAVIEVDGPEIPILDGSSRAFCEAIHNAGIQTQLQARPLLMLRRKVELKIAEKWAVAEPSSKLEVHGSVEWDHPAIGYQQFEYVAGKTSWTEIAGARTFGFLKDYEALKKMGLARGGSLDNAVVLDEARVLNPTGLRYTDEFVRHKVLDALGDFKLAGISIRASVRLHRAGHDLHSQLIAQIFSNPDHYEIIDGTSPKLEKMPRVRAAVARVAASVS
jgi:UDP-3-O-[3-hydroxymyristoyl] N-acetylglucosamine deacetylase